MIEAAAAGDYDVVLMDVRMPGMSGLEATRRIRALAGPLGRVPIVALTAQAFVEQVAECKAAGMDIHLAKPFAPEELLDAVARAAEAQSAVRAADPAPADLKAHTSRVDVAGSTLSVVPNQMLVGYEFAVCNPAVFSRTASFLTPTVIGSHLGTIAMRAEALLRALQTPDAISRTRFDLAAAAHSLAGSAGMFGFERIAAVARLFERAVEADAPDTISLAFALCGAIEASTCARIAAPHMARAMVRPH